VVRREALHLQGRGSRALRERGLLISHSMLLLLLLLVVVLVLVLVLVVLLRRLRVPLRNLVLGGRLQEGLLRRERGLEQGLRLTRRLPRLRLGIRELPTVQLRRLLLRRLLPRRLLPRRLLPRRPLCEGLREGPLVSLQPPQLGEELGAR